VRAAAALVTRDDGTPCDPLSEEDWSDWVAAGATRAYLEQDGLRDWLDRHGAAHGIRRDDERAEYDARFDFQRFLFEQGRRFADAVAAHLATLMPVTRIGGDARSREAAEETWRAMARGDHAIAHGALRDPQARMYGRVDLLVRSDALARLCDDAFDEGDDPAAPAPALDGAPWHYRVLEVRFSKLALLKDGRLSTTSAATMARAWALDRALGRIQGLRPPFAYVLGRSWRQGDREGRSCWERLARVPHDTYLRTLGASLADAVRDAAEWVRRVRREGASWEPFPRPSVAELWPNLKNDRDAPWHAAKRELAEALGELTLLRGVGVAHRARAHRAGVSRWEDPSCNATLLGVTRERELLEAILAANRGTAPLSPAHVAADVERWRDRARLERYVDFETVSDLADDFAAFPRRGGQALIFQIGCGALDDGRWFFHQFTARELSVAAEGELCDEWLAHLDAEARAAGLGGAADVVLFHWSAAETVSLDRAFGAARARHPERRWPDLGWYDLLGNVVRAEPVVAKGAFSFGLKDVARAMHRHGLIATPWNESLADGAGAMAGAFHAAEEARRAGLALAAVDTMREIGRYNEVDCRVMAEILDHLRLRH